MPTLITAVLFAINCAACEPKPVAAMFTPAGPSICHAIAQNLNDARQGARYPEFHCE